MSYKMLDDKSDLWKWCKSETGNIKNLALFLKKSKAFVSFMAHGKKKVPVELIPAISAYTNLRPKQLRPDIYELFKEDLK